jgi:hypothetical protein
MKTPVLIVVAVLCIAISSARAPAGDPARQFASPPADARPWVYWFIMDGNFSPEGVTEDLEAMSRAGIGGAILMEVDVGIPRGPVRFMSPEWRAIFKHAVREAERLGIEITLNAGPGWTGSGGPWVKPDQSMQLLVGSSVDVEGPSRYSAALPRPAPRKPYFGEKGLPPDLVKAMQDFYEDVAVLAIPATAASPLPDSDEKALYFRHPYSSKPGTKPYLTPWPADPGPPQGGSIPLDQVRDVTSRLKPDGTLDWEVPEGKWTILRFGRTSNGANTRPAPLPGLGLECDKFDRSALDAHFRDFVGALLGEVGLRPAGRSGGWTMLHIDSWEMGAQNWSRSFRGEFRRRRSYDPLPFLPAYTGRVVESREATDRFLWDLRQTAQELVIENHAGYLKTLAHGQGFGLSIEPYDMNPCADLALGGVADVPMCEFWAVDDGFETTFSCIEAVSIAHTNGRRVVGAEAFTGAGGSSWMRHPGSMKNQADWAFCTGINRIAFHRYAHQPWRDRTPGMTMGPYGTQYERTQTWWEYSRPWHEYLARCQFMLRRGLPVADILYLAPEGAPHVFRPPSSALSGTKWLPDRKGFNFDGCDPATLISGAQVRDGKLVFPDGMSYRVLVLPDVETMTPELLEKVESLLRAGATVVGPRPVRSPSLTGFPQCDARVRERARRLWGDGQPRAARRRLGKGMLVASAREPGSSPGTERGEFPALYGEFAQVAGLLSEAGVESDFESDAGLRFTHRRDGEEDIYFVSNPSDSPVTANCRFRVAGKNAELWDPLTGDRSVEPETVAGRGTTQIAVRLEGHGSVFVVFRNATAESTGLRASRPVSGGSPAQVEVPGPWRVQFQQGRGAPEGTSLETLMDLSRHPVEGIRHFSGTATYKAAVRYEGTPEAGNVVVVDLGRVEVVARVRLNGRDLGVSWLPPHRVAAKGALRQGENALEIEVANLWPNRLIGDLSLPAEKRVAWTTRNPFKPDSPLPASGLIGPVRLSVEEKAR